MEKLLMFACVCVALALVAPVAVLAQGQGATPDQYDPAPVPEGQDQSVVAIEDPNEVLEYVASQYESQHGPLVDCGDPPCPPAEQVQYDAMAAVEDAANDASGSSEELAGSLDAATAGANGLGGPASEVAKDPENDATVRSEETPEAKGAAGGNAGASDVHGDPAPNARHAEDVSDRTGRGLGRGGPDGPIVSGELPETGGAPSAALGAGALLLIGGLLIRRIVQ